MTVEGTSDIASQVQGTVVDSDNPQTSNDQKKVFYQDDVNRLIGREKKSAHEAGYNQALREIEAARQLEAQQKAEQLQQMQSQQTQAPQMQQQAPQQQMVGGMPQQPTQQQQNYLTAEAAKQLFQDEVEKQRRQAIGNQIWSDFSSKLAAGSSKHPDFDEKVAPLMKMFGEGKLPHVILLANGMDNTADVIYHLANNPQHIGNLSSNFQMDPDLARMNMQQLSHSIKVNEDAKQKHREASEPLSQVKPSLSGQGNGSTMSVKDFKRLLKV